MRNTLMTTGTKNRGRPPPCTVTVISSGGGSDSANTGADPCGGGETDPPTPNPATFASAPSADSSSAISMTATTGTDETGPVEYFFDETSGNPGGTDSGWVTNPVYSDTGLNGDTQYTYTVQMRDSLANTGTASSPANATTDTAPPDNDPPTPDPATFASAPAAVSDTEITMTATTGSDATGPVQYYFDETSGNPGATDSGWVTNPVYSDTGLDADTQYTYTVQMRDSIPNTGTASSPANATTDPTPSGDTVTITKAEYKADKSEFKVEATSSDQPNVTLTVVGYGTMTWKNNKYEFKGKPVSDPGATVTVTSSGGGSDVKSVTHQ